MSIYIDVDFRCYISPGIALYPMTSSGMIESYNEIQDFIDECTDMMVAGNKYTGIEVVKIRLDVDN